jgi:hypothetical protein
LNAFASGADKLPALLEYRPNRVVLFLKAIDFTLRPLRLGAKSSHAKAQSSRRKSNTTNLGHYGYWLSLAFIEGFRV